jgi:hypothetical protein
MKMYKPIPNSDQELKIEVRYNIGGHNHFNCKIELRGYYLSVSPVKRKTEGQFTTETYMAFSGVKKLILPVKRQSEKSYNQAVSLAEGEIPKLEQHILDNLQK